jgi:magnesium-protoporphyrin O-methyltransferase
VLFDAQIAERDLRRLRKRGGPDPSTRLILEGLRAEPLEHASHLDIGGGIGVLGLELVADGVQQVVHVDASAAYLAAARNRFVERGFGDRLRTVRGDFATLAEPLAAADIVTLDRVVCCYPDYEQLLARAASCTRSTLALSYPQGRWYIRMVFALENLWRWITRSAFRAYVHPPERMAAVLERSGLQRVRRRGTLIWAVDHYQRP